MILGYVESVKSCALISAIVGIIYGVVSFWTALSLLSVGDLLVGTNETNTVSFGGHNVQSLNQEINGIWINFSPFLRGSSSVGVIASGIQIVISVILMTCTNGDEVREMTSTWKCVNLVLFVALFICTLGPVSLDFLGRGLPTLRALERSWMVSTGQAFNFNFNNVSIYYFTLILNDLTLLLVSLATCALMTWCPDYHYEATLMGTSLVERRKSIVESHD